jgi:cysteine-rich repeat protein
MKITQPTAKCIGVCVVALLGPACGGGGSSGAGGGSSTSSTTSTTDTTSSGGGGSSSSSSSGGGGGGVGGTGVGGNGGGGVGGGGGAIPPNCGDGKLDPDEECDDGGNNANTAACTLACQHAECGDGFVQSGVEECDLGAQNSNEGACTLSCKVAVCGDGLKAPSEGCDDGNQVDADGCNTTCIVSGSGLWTQTHNGPANGNETWNGVAVDAAGNVIVTGSELVAGQGFNVITRKYDPSGNTLWTQTYAGVVPMGDDEGNGVAVDAAGNIAVIGYETTAMQARNIWIRKYAPNGATLWTQSVNGSPLVNLDDIGYGIRANAAGDFAIAASAITSAGQGRDTIVGKIKGSDGNFIWFDTYNGVANQDDEARAVALDSMGNLIAAGVTRGPNSYDIWVRKLDDLGMSKSIAWTKTYNGSVGALDAAFGVAVDAQNDVVVVGAESVVAHGLDMWIRKYDGVQGNTLWTQSYNGPGSKNDIAESVAVDASGNIVVVGFETVANQSSDLLLRKYDGAGNLLWSTSYNGAADSSEAGHGVAIHPSADIFVAGYENVVGQGSDGLLRRHAP